MSDEYITYEGKCHCGRIHFTIRSKPITTGVRCNCSICRRKNAVMSSKYYDPPDFQLLSGEEALSVYTFNEEETYHYFCKQCGIYPFHGPDQYRVNLGCIDNIDLEKLNIRVFDGRHTWRFFDQIERSGK